MLEPYLNLVSGTVIRKEIYNTSEITNFLCLVGFGRRVYQLIHVSEELLLYYLALLPIPLFFR